MSMALKSKHHPKEEVAEAVVHMHKDGKKHVHLENKESDKHDEPGNTEKSKSEEGNCCSDQVKSFQEFAKSVPASQSVIHPMFLATLSLSYYIVNIFRHKNVVKDIKPFRSYHPPIPDIRIAIQSFQI